MLIRIVFILLSFLIRGIFWLETLCKTYETRRVDTLTFTGMILTMWFLVMFS